MTRKAYRTTEGIPGIARAGEYIVIDKTNPGILVGRWLPWSDLARLMRHRSALSSDAEFQGFDQPKPPMRSQYLRLTS